MKRWDQKWQSKRRDKHLKQKMFSFWKENRERDQKKEPMKKTKKMKKKRKQKKHREKQKQLQKKRTISKHEMKKEKITKEELRHKKKEKEEIKQEDVKQDEKQKNVFFELLRTIISFTFVSFFVISFWILFFFEEIFFLIFFSSEIFSKKKEEFFHNHTLFSFLTIVVLKNFFGRNLFLKILFESVLHLPSLLQNKVLFHLSVKFFLFSFFFSFFLLFLFSFFSCVFLFLFFFWRTSKNGWRLDATDVPRTRSMTTERAWTQSTRSTTSPHEAVIKRAFNRASNPRRMWKERFFLCILLNLFLIFFGRRCTMKLDWKLEMNETDIKEWTACFLGACLLMNSIAKHHQVTSWWGAGFAKYWSTCANGRTVARRVNDMPLFGSRLKNPQVVLWGKCSDHNSLVWTTYCSNRRSPDEAMWEIRRRLPSCPEWMRVTTTVWGPVA